MCDMVRNMDAYCCGFNGFGQLGVYNSKCSLYKFENIFDIVFSWSSIIILTGSKIVISGYIGGQGNAVKRMTLPQEQKAIQVSCSSTQALFVTDLGQCWQYLYNNDSWRKLPDFLAIEEEVHSTKAECSQYLQNDVTLCQQEMSPGLSEKKIYQKIVQVNCGEVINVALCADGTAYSIPSRLHTPGVRVTAVACGLEHCLLLADCGAVYTWGSGIRGQLGHGVLESEESPRHVEALGGQRIIRIAAGGWHSAIVTDSGILYTWGWNNCGQLGFPTTDSVVDTSDVKYGGQRDILPIASDKFIDETNIHPLDQKKSMGNLSNKMQTGQNSSCKVIANHLPEIQTSVQSKQEYTKKISHYLKCNLSQQDDASKKEVNVVCSKSEVFNTNDINFFEKFEGKHVISEGPIEKMIKRVKSSNEDNAIIVSDKPSENTEAPEIKEAVTVLAEPMPVDLPLHFDFNVIEVGCGSRHTVVLLDNNTVLGCGWNAYGQLGRPADAFTSSSRMVQLPLPCDPRLSTVVGIRCGAWNTALLVEQRNN